MYTKIYLSLKYTGKWPNMPNDGHSVFSVSSNLEVHTKAEKLRMSLDKTSIKI